MRLYAYPLAFIILFIPFILVVEAANAETVEEVAVHDFFNRNVPTGASESSHTNNWAVLVCASRYWFNYRVRTIGPLHVSCA
jgi:phosphatidylinositol glycan class K